MELVRRDPPILDHFPLNLLRRDRKPKEIPDFGKGIQAQIRRCAAVGFAQVLPGELSEEEYIRDATRWLERIIGHATETEDDRLFFIDPRVSLVQQMRLFGYGCELLNPQHVVDQPNAKTPDVPYIVTLCDPPPALDPKEPYGLSFLTTWIPRIMRGVAGFTGLEGIAFLNQHPEIAKEHHNRYFLGSTYRGMPLKVTTDGETFVFGFEDSSVKRFLNQVPFCRRET